jgi:hypothetical protein
MFAIPAGPTMGLWGEHLTFALVGLLVAVMAYQRLQSRPSPAAAAPRVNAKSGKQRRRASSAEVLIIVGAVVIALIGFITSFEAVSSAMKPDFGDLAPLVPVGIDAGIMVSSAAYILLTRRGEGHPLLRLIPHGLTTATVYLNVASGDTVEGSIAHGVMVSLWAVAVEVATHVAKKRLAADTGNRFDPVPVRRWLVDPVRTALLYRRMALWNITEYRRALQYEKARRYAIGLCRAEHGRKWRWKVSPLLRYEIATGDLPDPVVTAIDHIIDNGRAAGWKPAVHAWVHPTESVDDESDHGRVVDPDTITFTGPAPGAFAARGNGRDTGTGAGIATGTDHRAHHGRTGTAHTNGKATRTGHRTPRQPVRTDAELLAEARHLNADHRATKGRDIGGDTLASALHVNKNRALAILRQIKDEDPRTPTP